MAMAKWEKWTHLVRLGDCWAKMPINQVDTESATQELCVQLIIVGFIAKIRCFYQKSMRGDHKRRATFFKNEHKLIPRKGCHDITTGNKGQNSVRYVRPTKEEADLVAQDPIQPAATVQEVSADRPTTTYKLLRSLEPRPPASTKNTSTALEMR